jgi:hypothetical protein
VQIKRKCKNMSKIWDRDCHSAFLVESDLKYHTNMLAFNLFCANTALMVFLTALKISDCECIYHLHLVCSNIFLINLAFITHTDFKLHTYIFKIHSQLEKNPIYSNQLNHRGCLLLVDFYRILHLYICLPTFTHQLVLLTS